MPVDTSPALGAFLRDRRTRLDPAALGYGGAPSADVLERIAAGLMLTEHEREHLFMLGLGRPPEPRYRAPDGVTPRLQRVLDSMSPVPAIIRTALWDVVAWNDAAAALLVDYAQLPLEQRNVLRLIFSPSRPKHPSEDARAVARYVVGAFRADAARAGPGAQAEVKALVDQLSRQSDEFAALWQGNDIANVVDGTKRIDHPDVGRIDVEFSAFAVDGRSDLGMVIFNPVSSEAAARIRALIERRLREKKSEESGPDTVSSVV